MQRNKLPCEYFAMGLCSRGQHCKFEHVGVCDLDSADDSSGHTVAWPPKLSEGRARCLFFSQGRCAKGDICRFSHLLEATADSSFDNVDCELEMGFDDRAHIQQTKLRPACRFYATGSCTEGLHCKFSHERGKFELKLFRPELAVGDDEFRFVEAATSALSLNGNFNSNPGMDQPTEVASCRFFAQGACDKGLHCPYVHEVREVVVPSKPCRYFEQGVCSKGSACPFAHTLLDLVAAGDDKFRLVEAATSALEISSVKGHFNSNPGMDQPTEVCSFFALGACDKGLHCPYVHEVREVVVPSKPCRYFEQGVCSKGSACPFAHSLLHQVNVPHGQQSENGEEEIKLPGMMRCIFGPGAQVVEILTDESSNVTRVCLNGLTEVISDDDISTVLSQFGTIEQILRKHATYAFVNFSNPTSASASVTALNGCLHNLWNKKCASNGRVLVRLAAGSGSAVTQNATVKVSWYAPSRVAWAHFKTQNLGLIAEKTCQGKQLKGRVLSTSFQKPCPRQRTSFSVWIGGIGDDATEGDVWRFVHKNSGLEPLSVTLGDIPFREKDGGEIVKSALERYGNLESFEEAPHEGLSLKRKAIAKYIQPEGASEAVKALGGVARAAMPEAALRELGNQRLFVERVYAAKISVLSQVYEQAQAGIATALSECGAVRHRVFPGERVTVMRISGEDPRGVSAAKCRLERAVAGERVVSDPPACVPVWHACFAGKAADAALEAIGAGAGGALVLRDPRRRELRLFGDPDVRARARAAVLAHVAAAAGRQHAVPIPAEALRPLLRQGLEAVATSARARAVSLDMASRALLVEGDKLAAERVLELLAALAAPSAAAAAAPGGAGEGDEGSACPVCLCPPGGDGEAPPVRLGCGHAYCLPCFDGWTAQASAGGGGGEAGGGAFPLRCYADGCGRRVPLRELRLRLPEDRLAALLRAAVEDHVGANPGAWQFCVTADCPWAYPLGRGRVARCGGCRAAVCTLCGVEEHECLTCHEFQLGKAPPNALRNRIVEEVLTLKCPRSARPLRPLLLWLDARSLAASTSRRLKAELGVN